MDYLRSCYTVDMDFAGDGTRVRRVRWYFAEEDAQLFPGPHSFPSANWFPVSRQTVGLGERWDSDRPYNSGATPPGASGQGIPCGPLDWFLNGVPPDAPDLVPTPSGIPTCCVPNPGILIGGVTSELSYRNYSLSGMLTGATSSLRTIDYPRSGLRTGALGYPRIVRYSLGGVLPGGTDVLRTQRPSLGGLKTGGTPALTVRKLSTGGLLVGAVGQPKTEHSSTGGILVGATDPGNSPSVKYPGQLGIKGAPTSVVIAGQITGCCPFNAVSNTLFGTTNGNPSQYVYSSGALAWQWFDSSTGQTVTLRCQNLGGGVFHWQLRVLPSTHCTITDTLTSFTCSPFTIDIQVTQSGASCFNPGTWHAILHA